MSEIRSMAAMIRKSCSLFSFISSRQTFSSSNFNIKFYFGWCFTNENFVKFLMVHLPGNSACSNISHNLSSTSLSVFCTQARTRSSASCLIALDLRKVKRIGLMIASIGFIYILPNYVYIC